MSLQAHVDRYVALKRHLGYRFVTNEGILCSWAAWAMARGDDLIVADTMLGWACDASSSAAASKRLSVGRRFAVWLQAEDPRHEVPPQHVLGPTTLRRPAPYLLTDAEIGTLMAAALSLPRKESITPHTWHCVIGLMATTGQCRPRTARCRPLRQRAASAGRTHPADLRPQRCSSPTAAEPTACGLRRRTAGSTRRAANRDQARSGIGRRGAARCPTLGTSTMNRFIGTRPGQPARPPFKRDLQSALPRRRGRCMLCHNS